MNLPELSLKNIVIALVGAGGVAYVANQYTSGQASKRSLDDPTVAQAVALHLAIRNEKPGLLKQLNDLPTQLLKSVSVFFTDSSQQPINSVFLVAKQITDYTAVAESYSDLYSKDLGKELMRVLSPGDYQSFLNILRANKEAATTYAPTLPATAAAATKTEARIDKITIDPTKLPVAVANFDGVGIRWGLSGEEKDIVKSGYGWLKSELKFSAKQAVGYVTNIQPAKTSDGTVWLVLCNTRDQNKATKFYRVNRDSVTVLPTGSPKIPTTRFDELKKYKADTLAGLDTPIITANMLCKPI